MKLAHRDSKVCYRSPKCRHAVPHANGIRRGRLDPNIEITRRTRDTMDGRRVSADDEKSGFGLEQGPQQIYKIRDNYPATSASYQRTVL